MSTSEDYAEELEEMAAFFNTRAETYNEVHLGHVDGVESKELIASFLPEHTMSIVDFGIGTGLELEAIFKRFPNVEITGIDMAENMLQLLRNTYPDKTIALYCMSFFDFDFGDNRYDAAISVQAMHHYTHEEKTALYRRIYKGVKKNGVYIENDYIISEEDYENPQEMEDFYFSEYERIKKQQGITDDNVYHYDRPCTVANQIKMLRTAGFKNVKEVWRKGNGITLVAEK